MFMARTTQLPVLHNASEVEKLLTLLAGGSLIAYGLGTRSRKGAALAMLGGGMIWTGVRTGLGGERATRMGFHLEKTVTVNKPAAELYNFWRKLDNLPKIMKHVELVAQLDEKRSHWVSKSPLGGTIEWDAEIVNDVPNQRIVWRSIENSGVSTSGSVEFCESSGSRGTEVHVAMQFNPPGGIATKALSKLFGEDPSKQLTEDLRRFKQLMETGEIATTEGQPSGRTSVSILNPLSAAS
jgi:uncharacterized membrane protein